MRHHELRKSRLDMFEQFRRNGKWGTCGDCPKTDGKSFPEFCINFKRSDHTLDITSMCEQYKLRVNRYNKVKHEQAKKYFVFKQCRYKELPDCNDQCRHKPPVS